MASQRTVWLAPVLGALLALGCVTRVTEEAVEANLVQAAASMSNLGRKRVIPVYAETRLLAKVLLYEAKHDPDSQLSLNLSRRIRAAAQRRMSVVIGGPYPELTEQVLSNALSLNREKGLGGLRVVLVSAREPSSDLARAATQARARLYHQSPR